MAKDPHRVPSGPPQIPTEAEIAAADDGQPDPLWPDKEIIEDCSYGSSGGWQDAVNKVVYLLHIFRGPWLLHADQLARMLRESENLPLDKEQALLTRVRTELATVINHPKADLAPHQQRELRAALDAAIKQTNQRLNAIPGQREREALATANRANAIPKVKTDVNRKPRRQATVNSRMIDVLQDEPEAMGWTARRWAEKLKCSPSRIVGTNTWKSIKLDREKGKAERASKKAREKRRK